jgi:hypothetical protein
MSELEKSAARFDVNSCNDMYAKLLFEVNRLENGWSEFDSMNFVFTAHHLYVDWISRCGTSHAQSKKAELPPGPVLVMQAVIDLSNGNKHWKVDRPGSLKKQVVTNVTSPLRGDWYSYLVAGPMVYIELNDYCISMRELTLQVCGYFAWILDENLSHFPSELVAQLEALRVDRGSAVSAIDRHDKHATIGAPQSAVD